MTRLPPIDLDPVMLAARVAQALSQSHRLAFVQLSPDLTVVQYSQNFVALLEQVEWPLKGRPISDLLWEFVGAEPILQDVLQGVVPYFKLEYVNRVLPNEEINYLNFQVVPLDGQQPERGLLLLVEDVTDYGRLSQTLTQDRNDLLLLQRELAQTNEQLFRLNRLKSLFISMAAHDLRSPLSVISGYAGLVRELIGEDDPRNKGRYLTIIETQALRISRLMNDLLDLDSIERGALELKLQEYDFVNIVREVIEIEQINFRGREIDLQLPDEPILLVIDKEKISRVMHNLVSNAFKYTPKDGTICVVVDRMKGEAIFKIEDNGQGMSPEQMSNLFQPYYRTEDAKESQVEGSGLGLFIVKMLVEAHDGQIEVKSAPGKGSTFIVRLPSYIE